MQDELITIRPHEKCLWLRIETPQLDQAEVGGLRQALAEAAGRSPSLPVVIDFSRVEHVASVALGALILLNRAFQETGQRFIIVGVTPAVRDVLSLTRLDKLLELHSTMESALVHLSRTEK